MSDDPQQRDLSREGQFDRELEGNIDLRPSDPVASGLTKEMLRIGMKVAEHVPGIGEVVKSVAALNGFMWQRRKPARAQELLLGIYERLERTRYEYARRDDFPDLLEETLRRTAEQPDPKRRETMREIFLKILGSPLSHVENRMLVRLADELPPEALKALAAVQLPFTQEEKKGGQALHILAPRLGIPVHETFALMTYLANLNLFDEHSYQTVPGFGAAEHDLTFLLTSLGRSFVEFSKGT